MATSRRPFWKSVTSSLMSVYNALVVRKFACSPISVVHSLIAAWASFASISTNDFSENPTEKSGSSSAVAPIAQAATKQHVRSAAIRDWLISDLKILAHKILKNALVVLRVI